RRTDARTRDFRFRPRHIVRRRLPSHGAGPEHLILSRLRRQAGRGRALHLLPIGDRGNLMSSSRKGLSLLVATKKGAWTLTGDDDRRSWEIAGPHFLGHIVHHMVLDPRDRRTLVVAARTGHLGPTVYRSTDAGRNWTEASRPPAFRKAAEGEKGLVVNQVFWLTPGHASEPGVWWAGTSPQGLFRSADGGDTWEAVSGFNDHPMRQKWIGLDEGTPDGPKLHSILIDPRDARHMYIGMSDGGVF